jgi:subtilisin family serine protease
MVGAMLLAFGGVVLAQQTTLAPLQSASEDDIQGRYIVVLEDGVSDPGRVANAIAERYDLDLGLIYRGALKGLAAAIPDDRLDEVRADDRVLFISRDREVRAFAQGLPTGVDRIEGDQSSAKSGDGTGTVSGVQVAIIDTGVDTDHPDLNVKGGKNCIGSGSSHDDGNGHGSHVAGTAAAKDNGQGVVGVAPGAPVYALRVLNSLGFGSTSSIICGIDAITGGAKNNPSAKIVANMSLGGGGSDDGNCGDTNSDAEHKAICRSVAEGVTYVVAAGNDGEDLKNSVPAAYDEVLTVTALSDFNGQPGGGATATCKTDRDETAANFSNFTRVGHEDADHTIAAPGVCIRSTWKGGGYNTISGTSMASPHVAGTAALCIANGKCSGLSSPSDIVAKLREDAKTKTGSDPNVTGYYGFKDDPNSPIVMDNGDTRYYGYLEHAGGY